MNYNRLYEWYEQNHRILPWRETENPYYIWISEIILQQTRVNQGMDYYLRMIERFPTVESMAEADEQEVLLYWQGLGYYSRARNMYKAAKMIAAENLNVHHFPDTFEALRALPGVGDYTAGAIASFAYNMPYPALDGNVYRVLSRLYDCEMPFDTSAGKKHFHILAEQLLDREQPKLFNSAMMELGAIHCVPQNPDCEQCPLVAVCEAYAHHTVEMLPQRKPRPKVGDRWFNYFIILTEEGHTYLHQRKEKDIWQHLYEFPLTESDHLLPAKHYWDCVHILSHVRIHARFILIKEKERQSLPPLEECIQVDIHELDQYPLAKLTLKALDQAFSDMASKP